MPQANGSLPQFIQERNEVRSEQGRRALGCQKQRVFWRKEGSVLALQLALPPRRRKVLYSLLQTFIWPNSYYVNPHGPLLCISSWVLSPITLWNHWTLATPKCPAIRDSTRLSTSSTKFADTGLRSLRDTGEYTLADVIKSVASQVKLWLRILKHQSSVLGNEAM